jgi:type II secretory pathway pseudopilin PulG
MKVNNTKNGSMLLELLIVIGVIAIVIPLVAEIVVSSLHTNKWSVDNKSAVGLIDETIAAVESISFEKWQNISSKVTITGTSTPDYSLPYYPLKSNGKWTLVQNIETIPNSDYKRYFVIYDVCRGADKNIVMTDGPCTVQNPKDPSTQKIIVTVTWANNTNSSTKEYYLTRWRNRICQQSDWNGAGSATLNCGSSDSYQSTLYSNSTNINTSIPGVIKLQAN